MNIQFRKLHLLIQHFIILQLRHTTFITQSLKEIHSGRETGLIDTGPLTLPVKSLYKIILTFRIKLKETEIKYRSHHSLLVYFISPGPVHVLIRAFIDSVCLKHVFPHDGSLPLNSFV